MRTARRAGRRLAGPAGLAAVTMVVAATLAGCAGPQPGPADSASGASTAAGEVTSFPGDPLFDYQLGGGYPPADGVQVVVRDSTDEPAPGLYSICYVNGFQTQPGADWPDELVLHDDSGAEVFDPGWPDERILDISTAEKREAAAAVQGDTVRGCAAAGFEAVEFDNLDSYTRSGGAFDLEAGAAFAALLVDAAHAAGLAAGQKNTPELGERGRQEIGFDFAVSEQCALYDECSDYTAAYGDRVLDIEYIEDLEGPFSEFCDDPATPAHAILRDRDLAPAGADGHVYESC